MLENDEFEQEQDEQETTRSSISPLLDSTEESNGNMFDSIAGGKHSVEELPLSQIFKITCFSFSYGLLLGTYAMVTIPIESTKMSSSPSQQALYFAFLLGLAGAAQLASPAAGFFSDRARSRWGKRRPFIIVGAIVGIICLLVQYGASQNSIVPYAIAFFISNLALNVISTASYGLIPDMVPESQAGRANGISTLWGVLGNCTGFLYYFIMADIDNMYWLYIISVTITCTVTCYSAVEIPTSKATAEVQIESKWFISVQYFHWGDLLQSYWVSPKEHRDFFLVLVGRTCFYIGVSVNAFLQFYFRDMIDLPNEGPLSDPGRATCVMAFVGQGAGILSAFPAGALSDRFGRKPLIVIGTAGIAVGYLGLLLATTPAETFYIGAFVGVANGAYQAVDLALALDTIPNKADSARYLGVWGVGSFLGACIGPAIGAPLLAYFGNVDEADGTEATYSRTGYSALMIYGVSILCLGTVVMLFVKSAR